MRYALSWIAWPALLLVAMALTGYGFAMGLPVLAFNLAYLLLALALLVLERLMPHEAAWNEDDGQTFASLAHTLLSKGTVQALVVVGAAVGLASLASPAAAPGHGLWPRHWPLWFQVAMGVAAAEFGLYWAHRLAHEWPPLWRFHAVHHSVTRLWIVNTGRFHVVNSLISLAAALAILFALGAPMEVLNWLSVLTAFVGLLTHCNVEMRFGPLSWVFNTPHLHRWHHSRDSREGNRNYGENLMLWDCLFGTYFNPPGRPPVDIGIDEDMPPGFLQQLTHPFAGRPPGRKAPRREAEQRGR